MNNILSKSESFKEEYCCSIVRLENLTPVESSDFLVKTNILGTQIVMNKNTFKEGDIVFYASNETSLNERFLSVNNLFEIGCREKNSNYEEVKLIMDDYDKNYRNEANEYRLKAKNIKSKINSFTEKTSKLNKQIAKLEDELSKYNNGSETPSEGRVEEINGKITEKRYMANEYTSKAMKLTVEYTDLKNKIDKLTKEGEPIVEKAKKMCGFFNKYGRVRCITLRNEPSFGFIFNLNEMVKYCPEVAELNLEEHLNEDFDTVNGELFVKAFVPPIKEVTHSSGKNNKLNKKLSQFDRLIDGEFSFHYETLQLGKYIRLFNPDSEVTCSVKIHGSSICIGKLHVKEPKKIAFYKRLWNLFADRNRFLRKYRFIDYNIVYGPVYSSRKVIKNRYINENVNSGFYSKDIWSEYGDLIYPYLEEGMTVYGEIFGYVTNSDKMIQKLYDYGCNQGENKIMFYRISTLNEDGTKREWEVDEVYEWTKELIERMKENGDDAYERIHPIDILYSGTLGDLYPSIDRSNHWNENVLDEMKKDKEHFGMEEYEPMCVSEVPREGICVRVKGSKIPSCYKLKTLSFAMKEAILMDSGEVDMEMQDNYTNENDFEN